MKKRTYYLIYIALFFLICAFPLLGMHWYHEKATTENKVLAEKPDLKSADGSLNYEYLPQMGAYFSDHFAGRQELVTTNALIRANLFDESSEDIVVVGKDGWLFYKNSVKDYQGIRTLSNRGVFNVTKNLSLMKEYVESRGKKFVLAVAPNKNSIYPEYMPDYLVRGSKSNNLSVLEKRFKDAGISYVDLKSMFLIAKADKSNADITFYHKGDSHWNNIGAAMAQNEILNALGKSHTDLSKARPALDYNFEGDLDQILYPLAQHKESEYNFDRHFSIQYQGNFKDTTDMQIETAATGKKGTIVMFRDSFGNSLVPFVANEYAKGIFTKTVPYQVDDVDTYQADAFVLEVAERNIDQFGKSAAVMDAPERKLDMQISDMKAYDSNQLSATGMELDGYLQISGLLDAEYTDPDSPVYVVGEDGENIYEAAPVYDASNVTSTDNIEGADAVTDYGYTCYINVEKAKEFGKRIRFITKKDGQYVVSQEMKLNVVVM